VATVVVVVVAGGAALEQESCVGVHQTRIVFADTDDRWDRYKGREEAGDTLTALRLGFV
jgi:hypothetical protein